MYKPAYDANLFKGSNDPYFGGQNWVEKLNVISVHPGTSAPVMGPYDFHIGRSHEQGMQDVTQGKGANASYANFLRILMERAPELTN